MIHFIRDNVNVEALRADIVSILSRGEKIDQNLGRRIVSEVLESELSAQKKMRKYRLLGAALSLLVPGSSLLTEAAVEGAALAGEAAAEGAFPKPHRWFYSLKR